MLEGDGENSVISELFQLLDYFKKIENDFS